MQKTPWIVSALFALGLACAWPEPALAAPGDDVVALKDGRVLQGQVVEEGKDNIVILVNGVKRSYGRSFISKISYGSGPAALASAAAGPAEGANIAYSVPAPRAGGLAGEISARYQVPVSDVLWVRAQGIPDVDLPLVFLVAATARVVPRAVVKLRLKGWSWAQIETHYGMRSEYVRYEPGPWVAYPYYYYPGVGWGWGWGWHGGWGWGWGHGWGRHWR